MALKDILSVPTYTTNLPSSGKEVKFRPFLVKEEKVLLIAKQSKNLKQIYDCIKTTLSNCILEPKQLNLDKLPYYDVEYLFLNLRAKSMGESIDIMVTDPETKEKFETQLDIEKIEIENLPKDKKHNKIKLSSDLALEMSYPSFNDFLKLSNHKEKQSEDELIDSFLEIASLCVTKVYTKSETISCSDLDLKEIKEFLESLSKDQFEKIGMFFQKMPKLLYKSQFTNPMTQKTFPIEVRDFTNFFTLS